MSCNQLLYMGSTVIVWIEDLKDAITDAVVTGATGVMNVVDSDDVAVESAIAMVEVGAGDYYFVFAANTTLTENADYTLQITITSGTNTRYVQFDAQAVYDTGTP